MTLHRAVYPGSFDPLTLGHIDLIYRGIKVVDELVVAVLANPEKNTLFSTDERVTMLQECVGAIEGVRVDQFNGLLADYARERECNSILRGLRAISDFEYEFQMALMNRRLNPDVDTLYLMPSEEHVFVSSRIVREVAQFGGDLSTLVPDSVARRLKEQFG